MSDPSFRRYGMMFILSSPSGAGKTTISRAMLERDTNLCMSVSATTRPKRPNETDGKDYYFVSEDEFAHMALEGEFLEHAKVFGNYYGTPKKHVEKLLKQGKDILFDIDWQGTRQLTKIKRKQMISVFILPPSLKELERRLRARNQDSDDVVKARMNKAVEEICHWEEYDYIVINTDLERTLQKVMAILQAERLTRRIQPGLKAFVEQLCNGE